MKQVSSSRFANSSLRLFAIFFIWAAAENSSAQNPTQKTEVEKLGSGNCVIMTTSLYRDGEVKKETTVLDLKSKSECLKMQKIFSDNFSPREIKSVVAKAEWIGP